MTIKLQIVLFLILPLISFSAFEQNYFSAEFCAMAEATVAKKTISVYSNPATLSQISSLKISTTYTNLFNIEEIKNGNFIIVFPVLHSTFASSLSMLKLPLYKEQTFFISYAKEIKNMSVGINLKHLLLDIETIGSKSNIGIDFGFFYKLNKKIDSGLFIENINSPTIIEKLQPNFKIGFLIKPEKDLCITLDVIKENYYIEPYLGSEIKIFKEFLIRFGIKPFTKIFSCGFGLKISKIDLDYAFISHPVLSYSHIISLTIKK